jgi:DNA polymerase-3 subunit delta'
MVIKAMILYPWQDELWSQWQGLIRQNRLHHAMLLTTPAGCGDSKLIEMLSQTLLCQSQSDTPCGLCHSCQLMSAGSHPDFHRIHSEDKSSLGVDRIRQTLQKALSTSQLGKARIIWLENITEMTSAAANALLKTLEEPPEQCYFLLTSHTLNGVLPTILSRCNHWHLPAPSEVNCLTWLLQQPTTLHEARSQWLKLNGVAPLAVFDFLSSEKPTQYSQALQIFAQFLLPPHLGLFALADDIEKLDLDGLIWLGHFLMDIVKTQQGLAAYCVHEDEASLLSALALALPQETVLTQITKLNRLHHQLQINTGLNRNLLLVAWLTEFLSENESVSRFPLSS